MEYKLGDLCIMKSGGTPRKGTPEFYGGDIPWVKISDFKNSGSEIILHTEETITRKGLEAINNRLFKKGTLLLAMYGSVGKVAITGIETSCNQAILGIIPKDENILNLKYLKYWFEENKEKLVSQGRGAALNNISATIVKKQIINLPDLPIQNKIVAILDKTSSLAQKRNDNIKLLDEFLRAQFVEMFGDMGNPMNEHMKMLLIETCNYKNDIRCGPFGTQLSKSEFKNEGVPLWGIKHINNSFRTKTDEFVSKEKAEKLKNYTLFPRDILMTRKGSVGNCHIYPKDKEMGIMHSDILRIRVDEKIVNPYFLYYQFKHNEYVQWQIQRVSPGVVMAGINVSKLKKVLVSVPPLDLQNQFEDFYHKSQSEKELLINSRIELKNLYNALLQRAFSGQLNLNEDIELDALLASIDTEKEKNDIRDIATVYAGRLLERLDSQAFANQMQYKQAKHVAFQLLKEGNIVQEYDEDKKAVKMKLV